MSHTTTAEPLPFDAPGSKAMPWGPLNKAGVDWTVWGDDVTDDEG